MITLRLREIGNFTDVARSAALLDWDAALKRARKNHPRHVASELLALGVLAAEGSTSGVQAHLQRLGAPSGLGDCGALVSLHRNGLCEMDVESPTGRRLGSMALWIP